MANRKTSRYLVVVLFRILSRFYFFFILTLISFLFYVFGRQDYFENNRYQINPELKEIFGLLSNLLAAHYVLKHLQLEQCLDSELLDKAKSFLGEMGKNEIKISGLEFLQLLISKEKLEGNLFQEDVLELVLGLLYASELPRTRIERVEQEEVWRELARLDPRTGLQGK